MKSNEKVFTTENKSVVTTKAGEIIQQNVDAGISTNVLKNVLSQLQTQNLKTSKGLKKENIYRISVFSDCLTDREKKTRRRQIRNLFESFISSMLRCKSISQKESIAADFVIFYREIYSVNDFTLESLISNNSDDVKKENVSRFIEEIKKYKKS